MYKKRSPEEGTKMLLRAMLRTLKIFATLLQKRASGSLSWRFACLSAILLIAAMLHSMPVFAQAVTWTQNDIGAVGIAGTYNYSAGTPPVSTIAGGGAGLGFVDDAVTYVNTPAVGACELSGQVFSQTNTGSGAMAGFCLRNSIQTSRAASYAIIVTPSNGVSFLWREQGGGTNTTTVPAIAAPVFLKLARTGTSTGDHTITGYYSTDGGINWTAVGSRTESNANPMPNKFTAGFVVSSSVSGTLSTAVFKSVAYMTSVPQQAANLLLWLRADSGVTSSGGAVSSWADSSGSGNTATQSTGAAKPTLVTGVANSGILPAVSFNGTSQYLTLPTDFSNLSSGIHVFAVVKPSSGSATGTPFTCANSGNNDAVILRTAGQNVALYAFQGSTSSNVTTSSNPLSTSNYQLVEASFTPGASAGTGKIVVNGSTVATATNLVASLNNTSRASNFIGVESGLSNYFGGDICEVLVYSNPLSQSQFNQVRSYILSKYAVGSQPTLETPVISPSSAVVLPQQQVMLSQSQDALVYYTTNGNTPTDSDLWFFSNVSFFLANVAPEYIPRITKTTTVKAIAKAPFFNDSPVATATLQVEPITSPIPRSGLIQWLRASNVTTSGSNVTTWNDISGSLNDPSGASNQPTLVASAVNGLPAVNFNGSQYLQMPSGFANFTSGLTAILVAKPTSVSAGARFFDLGNGSTSDNVILSLPSSTGLTFSTYTGSSGSSATASSGLNLGQFQLLEALYNGSNSATLFQNGGQIGTSSSMNTLNNLTRNSNYLGQDFSGANRFNGQIAEMLLWNRQITLSERTAVEGYLLNKYLLLSTNAVAAPTFSVSSTTFAEPSQVAIAAPTGAKIYLTLDGSTPSTSSQQYEKPLWISYSQTLKAIAVLNGISSSVTTGTYTLDSTKWPAPSASDARTLDLKQQLPNVGIPHDASQP